MFHKPKDHYETEEEREAWQKGYNAFEAYRGPLDSVLPDDGAEAISLALARASGVHPLAAGIMGELLNQLPRHLHTPLFNGFGTAFEENKAQNR